MDFEEQNREIRDFCEAREWDQFHSPKELAIGLSTESNELLELFRFKNRDDQTALLNDAERRTEVEDELADVLFFLLRFADLYDIDLETALASKIDKNRTRYPKEEFKSSNKKYDE